MDHERPTTAFLSWSLLKGFLDIVSSKRHRDIMKHEDIDYWYNVFVVSDAVAINAYDMFGCKLTQDVHMHRFRSLGATLDEASQVLVFPRPDETGNPVLWHMLAMFEYMLGKEDERTSLLQRALAHIDSVVALQNDIDSCINSLASCRPFFTQTERTSPPPENCNVWTEP